jgi:L-threonylcarbamoyladenylate synthase
VTPGQNDSGVTRVLLADNKAIAEAARLVRAGRLVAFPTETVYGLGANALDAAAVQGIFEAKRRPADDPLIVHVTDARALERVARPNEAARRLAERFWPGALTLVLPRQPIVPPAVTAGLETVGVRVPSHPVALDLLRAADLPIAAPSANLFGRPSPTRAEHVLEDLGGRVDLVLDGGTTMVGVESTIVDLASGAPRLLRPGGVPAEAIEAALGVALQSPPARATGPQVSPGLLNTHYAPRTPLVLVLGEPERARQRLRQELEHAAQAGLRVGVLLLAEDQDLVPASVSRELLGSSERPESLASRLFDALRALDRSGLERIYARTLADPSTGLGRALADRLRRAAAQVVDA